MDFIEFDIPDEMVAAAEKEAAELGELRNSVTKGEGNIAGFLGEFVAEKVTGYVRKNTRDYDLVNPDNAEDTVDVKTKRCSSEPNEYTETSILAFNTAQKCKKYLFVRVLRDYSKAWVCGELKKEEYFKKATFIQQGQYNPVHRYRYRADCYNAVMSDLDPVTILKKKPENTEETTES